MLLPDMDERTPSRGFHCRDQRRGRRRRAVVGDDHLELAVLSAGQRTQYGVERVLAVEGGDDDGDQRAHRLAPLQPRLHVAIVGALGIGDRQQEPLAPVEEARAQQIECA